MLNTLRIVTTLVIFRGILGIQINFKKNFISQGHLLAEKSTWRPDYFRRLNLANFNVLNTNKDCYDMIFFKISLKYNLILFILTIMYFSTIVIINKLLIYPPPRSFDPWHTICWSWDEKLHIFCEVLMKE